MRRITLFIVLCIALGAPAIAQGQEDVAPFGAFFTDDPDVGLVAVMPNGDTMGVLTEKDKDGAITALRGAVWHTEEGAVTVMVGDDGLPESMAIAGVTLRFDNYGETTVDITVVPDDDEAFVIAGMELDPQVLSILRGFASLSDEPLAAKRNGLRSLREIGLRSVATLAHVGGAAVSSVSCLSLGFGAATSVHIVVGTAIAPLAALACVSAMNTIVTIPSTVIGLWNAVVDPTANLVRLQQTDEAYVTTSQSIMIDLATMQETSGTAVSIGLTVVTASLNEWANAELQIEAAYQAVDVIRRQQENSDAGDIFSEFNSPPPGLEARSPTSPSIGTLYDTSNGVMTIGVNRATYADDKGRILFQRYGRSLVGYWIEDESGIACDYPIDGSRYWGQVILTFSEDYNTFEGTWGYCSDAANIGSWNGVLHAR